MLKSSLVGDLLLAADSLGLRYVSFQPPKHPLETQSLPAGWEHSDSALKDVRDQLLAYFSGRLQLFNLPLAPAGTPFQRSVWNALCQVPWGKTASYSEIAEAIGNPRACRAVGLANGRNPIPIIIPCHRIIGRDQRLVGYSGGLHLKKILLDLEDSQSKPRLF
ncbi:MAG: methylated-DNA--[protein]-cysteine S-methyltransferase [Planctomycetia bacterium]